MKIGKWRVEFKTTITRDYKDIKEVPFWRLYIVRREPKCIIDKETGELLHVYKQMVVYWRSYEALTYDEVIAMVNNTKNLLIHCDGEVKAIGPDTSAYIVAYPRRTKKMRV